MSFKDIFAAIGGQSIEEQRRQIEQEKDALEAEKRELRTRLEAEAAAAQGTRQQPCVALINIDNYDELLASSPAEDQSSITAEIDRIVRSWTQSIEASIVRVRSSSYIAVFDVRRLQALRESKFSILEDAHAIKTSADFPVSLSIGIGTGSARLDEQQTLAEDAMELAQGRGGDQVVIKNERGDLEYFGGALMSVEKRNKGRSRVMLHALRQHMRSCDKVLIMGHAQPDMDALGAAIGVAALAKNALKENYIVLDGPSDGIDLLYAAMQENGRFTLMDHEAALAAVTPKTLVVVVDTHIPYRTECPELLEAARRVAVIDHHRRSKDAVADPVINYMESYASSCCELITEMLQYSGGEYEKFELEALLSGITLDTKNFTVNTGARTFEAAAWLRRSGADVAAVRRLFKVDLNFYKKKVNLIASAEVIGDGVAVAYTRDRDPAMQILVAKAADELLEMRGVNVTFVAGCGEDETMISARSDGKVNVQNILEKLGGGGHLTVAGAQVQMQPEEAIARIVTLLREEQVIKE